LLAGEHAAVLPCERRDRTPGWLWLRVRARGTRRICACAGAASPCGAISGESISTWGRSMTFWPVTGRQRSARSREFLA